MNKKYQINEKEISTGQPDAKRSIYVAEQAILVGNNGDIENPNPQAQNAELQGIPIKSQGAASLLSYTSESLRSTRYNSGSRPRLYQRPWTINPSGSLRM
ncbi:unnamed protein product [Moneuplotes crassus]|uniref:Uncharacterized protein n=1 Tax=Euplotes crassus TaxID=5936 RepID=A0AAD1XXJ4_EUPCR|nr:unnamed protein product [Moneuplotes crassus]